MVWARREVTVQSCPKALIRAASMRWLEEFSAWKAGGGGDLMGHPARTAEAFFVLEQELSLSRDQLRAFAALFRMNTRGLQEAHGRRIEANE